MADLPHVGLGKRRECLSRVGLQTMQLFDDHRGDLGERLRNDVRATRKFPAPDSIESGLECVDSFALKRILSLIVPPLTIVEEAAHSDQRIVGLPQVLFFLCSVQRRVIGSCVGAKSVAHSLDQCGALSLRGPFHSPPGRVIHGKGIEPIDFLCRHPVADGLVGDPLRRRLLLVGNADRVEVVRHDEHGRGLPHTREVQSGVEVVLRRATVADIRHRHHIVAEKRLRVCVPHGVRQVSRNRDRDHHLIEGGLIPQIVGKATPVREQRFERYSS